MSVEDFVQQARQLAEAVSRGAMRPKTFKDSMTDLADCFVKPNKVAP